MNKKYNLTCAQDWVESFETIFDTIKIDNMLEFGLGVGTEFLCDNCKTVTSVELSLGDYNKQWTDKTKDLLKNYKNWKLHYIELPEQIKKSNKDAIEQKYPIKDISYLPVLKNIIDPFLNDIFYDMIFVDAGIHNRGDIVNFCFNKAKIIAAHDTCRKGNVIENIYGYNIVKCPDNYHEIHISRGLGTTFWIQKNCYFLIEKLQTKAIL